MHTYSVWGNFNSNLVFGFLSNLHIQLCRNANASTPLLGLNIVFTGTSNKEPFLNTMRALSTSSVRHDIDSTSKLIGAGIATLGFGSKFCQQQKKSNQTESEMKADSGFFAFAADIVSTFIFGKMMINYARNPSSKTEIFNYALLGFVLSSILTITALVLLIKI